MSLTTIGSEANILNDISRYNLEAFRAVNQAIGRVIRHKNDFGAVLVKLQNWVHCFRAYALLSRLMWSNLKCFYHSVFFSIQLELKGSYKAPNNFWTQVNEMGFTIIWFWFEFQLLDKRFAQEGCATKLPSWWVSSIRQCFSSHYSISTFCQYLHKVRFPFYWKLSWSGFQMSLKT